MELEASVVLNGIDGASGAYLQDAIDLSAAAALVRREGRDPAVDSWLRRVWRSLTRPHLGLAPNVRPEVVAEAGWGVVFHRNEDPAVKAALEPLIAHRRRTIENDARVKVLEYIDGESRARFLARHGVGAASVVPDKVPYYLLLAGGPERIPFSVCHDLDVEYAVGCLQFDTPEEYRRYAESVIALETGNAPARERRATFFATRHSMDAATRLSADNMVRPLIASVGSAFGTTSPFVGESACKSVLIEALRGRTARPAFLMTASHGIGWPCGDARQAAAQGALLCQDWPPFTAPEPAHYVAASDVAADAEIHGLVAFVFACYGAGTPSHDRYAHNAGEAPPRIAPKPFIAALPKALLAHPRGGALAVIGHIERAWGYSIVTPNAGPQLLPFENALLRIAAGEPVGHAMKDFNEKYAALSTTLSSLLEQKSYGAVVSERELAAAWAERNDAGGYMVIGDPAVSLRVEKPE
jgi:hypothetical protein